MKLEDIFFQVGFKTAKHPCLVCTASLLITLSLMLGFLFLEMEVSAQSLININPIYPFRSNLKNYG